MQWAADKYDWRKGFRFSTYSYWWIRQAITRGLSEKGRSIRIPVNMVDVIRDFSQKASLVEGKTGGQPNRSEIAEALGMDEQRVEKMLDFIKLGNPASLEGTAGAEDDAQLQEFIPDPNAIDPATQAEHNDLRDKVNLAIDKILTPKEAKVIRLRFGIGGQPSTLSEIGEEMGFSRERARQLEAEALGKLRRPGVAVGLAELLS